MVGVNTFALICLVLFCVTALLVSASFRDLANVKYVWYLPNISQIYACGWVWVCVGGGGCMCGWWWVFVWVCGGCLCGCVVGV